MYYKSIVIVLMLAGLTICYLILAGLSLYGNTRRTANVLFSLIAVCFAVWSFGMALFMGGSSTSMMRLGAKLFYFAATCFAPLLLFFIVCYPRVRKIVRYAAIVPIVTTTIIAVLLALYPNFIITTIKLDSNGWTIEVNRIGYIVFAVPFVAYFFAAMCVDLWRRLHYSSGMWVRRLYYMGGIVATSIPGFVFDLVLPFYGEYRWIWIGPLASVIFLGTTLYSMARFRMLHVKSFLVQAVTYASLIVTFAACYGAAFFGLSQVFLPQMSKPSPGMFILNTILVLAAAFAFQPLRRMFDRYAERIFYHRKYSAEHVVNVLTRLTVRSTDLDTLLHSYLRAFSDMFRPRYVAVVFKDAQYKPYAVGKRLTAHMAYDAITQLKQNGTISMHGIAVLLPLCVSTQEIGYLVIGEGKDEREYRKRDIALFGVLADQLSIALLNIFRLEEIRRFAGTLEHEVNDATAQLRRSNEQLRFLDTVKDEFVSMASHQLRTPLTSVKGYLSMVLDGDAGEISTSQRQLLQEAFTSSERMVHLISDFLNVSRLQTGKFVIDRVQTDLVSLVAEEVANVSQVASAHKVNVKFRKPARFPLLYLDENKLRQVIMNLIDNAIYYSPNADTVRVRLSIEDGDVVLRVVDHGMGVPKDAQKRLFTKFFRAENARRQRPDGTGIGLYLAKKVIHGHGGSLIFESELGKGSTFGFRLPIRRLEKPPKKTAP